jgi:hypothetical protein
MPVEISGPGIGAPSVSTTTVTSSINLTSNILSTSIATAQVSVNAPNMQSQDVKTSLPDTALVNLSRLDLQNLDVSIKPASTLLSPPDLGDSTSPFGDLFLSGETLYLQDRSISITTIDSSNYIDLGANVIIGVNHVNSSAVFAYQSDLTTLQLTNNDIGELKNVTTTGITDGQVLAYESSLDKFIPANVSGSGTLTGADIKTLLEAVDGQVLTSTTTSAAVAGTFVADTFPINTLRSAKYVVTISDSDDTTYYIAEVLLIHNGYEVNFTIYGEVVVGSLEDINPSYSADIVDDKVRLLIETFSDQQTIKLSRIGSLI